MSSGKAFTVTARALDASGHLVTTYNAAATWSDLSAHLSPTTPALFVNGVSTTTTAKVSVPFHLDKVKVMSGGLSGTSAAFNVYGPLHHITVVAPGSAQSGTAFTLKAYARDIANNTLVSYNASGTWSDLSAHLSPATPAAFVNGVSTTLTAKVSVPFHLDKVKVLSGGRSGTSAAFNVYGPLHHITVVAPGSAQSGTAFTVKAYARDIANNTLVSYNNAGTWSDLSAQLSPATPAAFVNGVSTTTTATVSVPFHLDKVKVLSGGRSGTSAAFNVYGPLDHLSVSVPAGPVDVGTSFTVTSRAFDSANNLLKGYNAPATWTDLSGQLSPASPSNFVSGVSTTTNASVSSAQAGETIKVTTNGIYKDSAAFDVVDINHPPTDISLSSSSIDENQPSGTTIGTFSATDPDASNTFTFSLADSGCGGASNDDSSFSVTGGTTLESAAGFNYEAKNSYTICAHVDDPGSTMQSFEKQMTITIGDVDDAPVANPDDYSGAIGNTNAQVQTTSTGPVVTLSGNSLIANDTDEDTTFPHTLSAVAETVPSTQGGSVTINSDGSFVYTPPVGLKNADDTFTYQLNDQPGDPSPSAGTATIHIDNFCVWYVNAAAGAGDGRSGSPFNTLGAVNAASSSGDHVFLYSGTYPGGLVLKSNQSLWGQTYGLTVDGANLVSAGGTNPVIQNSGGAGITLANAVDVQGVDVNVSGGVGISGSSITSATVDNTTSGSISSANPGGGGVSLSGANSGDITIGASITTSSGHSVSVSNRSSGTVAFSGAINDTGTGILLNSNTGATFNFTGGVVASTGANGAFSAIAGGTVNVTGSNSTLATTTKTALDVENTTIGSSGLTFKSVSAGTGASGPTNGILLSNTGSSGGLTITGNGNTTNGGDSSGGTIQHTTARGIQLTNTDKVSLDNIKVDTTGNAGIGGSGVTDFTLTYSTVSNNGSNGTSLDSNIDFGTATGGSPTDDNVDGVVTITNNALTNAHEHGIDIQNYSGTISNATISNNTLTSATSAASSFGSGIRLLGFGSAGGTSNLTKATISGNTIKYFPGGAGITAQFGNSAGTGGTWGTPGNATNLITISGNTITGFSQAAPVNTNAVLATLAGNGQAHWNITGNTASLVGGTYIGVTVSGVAPVAQADITNNNLTGMVSSAAQTIAYAVDYLSASTDHPTLSGTISGNTISSQDGEGIQALATSGSSGTLNASIVNNTISAPSCSGCNRFGMTVNAGLSTTVTGTPTVCAKISGNTAAGSGVDTGIGFRKRTGATLNIDGFPTPGNDPTAYITGLNPLGGGVTNITSSTAGSCTAP